jgi:hypothetical protein
LSKGIVLAVAMLSIIFSVSSIVNVNIRHKQMDEMFKSKINMLVNSHFIGCARVSAKFDLCRELSEQYREQIKKDLGL